MCWPIFIKDFIEVTKFDRHGVRQQSSVIKYRGWRYAFFRQRQTFDGDDLQIRQRWRLIVDRQICHGQLELSSISKCWQVSDWSKKAYVALHVGPIWLLTTWVRRCWRGYLSCGTGMVLTCGTHKILWQAGPTIFWPVGSTKFWQVGPGCCRHMGPNNADWWDPQNSDKWDQNWCHVVSFNGDVVTFSVTFRIYQNLRTFELFAKFWKQNNWQNITKK